jgi:hypothetical protein
VVTPTYRAPDGRTVEIRAYESGSSEVGKAGARYVIEQPTPHGKALVGTVASADQLGKYGINPAELERVQ